MIDDRQDELAALSAFDLLEGDERARFCAALASHADPELRRRATELHEAAAALAHLAPPADPPAVLRTRILASLDEPAARPAAPLLSFSALIPWALAACFAVAALGLGGLYWSGRSEKALLSQQAKLAELEARAAHDQLEGERILRQRQLADERQAAADARTQVAALDKALKTQGELARFKIATLASMLGNTPTAMAVAVWDPARQQGVLEGAKLPALAAGQDYQLWLVDPQYPDAVSGGVFQVDPDTGTCCVVFRTDRPIKSVAKFAVSLERKGGVTKRQGPLVLLSQ